LKHVLQTGTRNIAKGFAIHITNLDEVTTTLCSGLSQRNVYQYLDKRRERHKEEKKGRTSVEKIGRDGDVPQCHGGMGGAEGDREQVALHSSPAFQL
jgi:hypothetical protein